MKKTTPALRKINTLVLLLEKAVRSVRMYPPGHPKSEALIHRTHRLLTESLEESAPLSLDVDRHRLLLGKEPVYTNTDNSESLAFALYQDGIREVSVEQGIEIQEVRELALALAGGFQSEALEDDLATTLWEKNLAHVSIAAIEDYFEDFLPEEMKNTDDLGSAVREKMKPEALTPGSLRGKILTEAITGKKMESIPLRQTVLSPGQLRLNPAELAHLRELRIRDISASHFEAMIEIMLSILSDEEDPEQIDLFITLFDKLVKTLLSSGPLEQAVHLIELLRRYVDESRRLQPDLFRKMDRFLRELGNDEDMAILGESLKYSRLPDPDRLPDLLELFPLTAARGISDLFEDADSIKTRKLLCQSLARMGFNKPSVIVCQLNDHRWFVVRNLAYTLGLIGNPEVLPHLGGLVEHDDPRVRKEALRALCRSGQTSARHLILKGAKHPDPQTRRQALHSLPKTPDSNLAQQVQEMISSPGFDGRDIGEREMFFRVLGRLSTDHAVPMFEKLLSPRRVFSSRRRREEQYLAAAALAALDSEAARGVLRNALPRADGRTAALIRKCIKEDPRRR